MARPITPPPACLPSPAMRISTLNLHLAFPPIPPRKSNPRKRFFRIWFGEFGAARLAWRK